MSEAQASFMRSFPSPAGASSMSPVLPMVGGVLTPNRELLSLSPFQALIFHDVWSSLQSSFEFPKTQDEG